MRSKKRESESIVLLGSFVLCFFPDSISSQLNHQTYGWGCPAESHSGLVWV